MTPEGLEAMVKELNNQADDLNFGLAKKGDRFALTDHNGRVRVTPFEEVEILAKVIKVMIEFFGVKD